MKFRICHILAAATVIAVLLGLTMAVLSPVIRLSREIDAAQRRIMNELDHVSIRDAALGLLLDPADRVVDLPDLPQAIAQTDPMYVVVIDGTVRIEYGGGFGHYGLIIDTRAERSATDASANVYYEETKLIEDVYFYDTE